MSTLYKVKTNPDVSDGDSITANGHYDVFLESMISDEFYVTPMREHLDNGEWGDNVVPDWYEGAPNAHSIRYIYHKSWLIFLEPIE